MPQTPEERRKTFDSLAKKRQEMIDDERAKQVGREIEAEERTKRQKEASLAEQAKAEQGSEAREEWREGQHEQREEMLKAAKATEEERARQEAKKATEAVEDEKRTKKMRDLHDRAISQKVGARKLQATHIEEDADKNVNDQLERDLRDVDHVLDRTLEHLVQDRRRKIAQLDDDTNRYKISMTETYRDRKKTLDASKDPRAGAEAFQLTAQHKRALMTTQERTEEARLKIESEYTRLKDEASLQAEQKRARLRSIADQRKREAKTRHENADEWIDSHRN